MASESEATAVDHDETEDRSEPKLFVVSLVRKWQTRGLRRRPEGGKRHRFNLILCGGKIRLLRGKSRPLPVELLRQFRNDLAEKMRTGQIDIRVGGPNGCSIGLPDEEGLTEVPCDDSQEKDAQTESSAGSEGGEPGVEMPEGGAEDELQEQEEVEESADDEPEESPEADDELEEEEVEEVEEGSEASIPEPDKPLDRMNKAELIDYCVKATGMDAADLESMVKREILEAIQGALES